MTNLFDHLDVHDECKLRKKSHSMSLTYIPDALAGPAWCEEGFKCQKEIMERHGPQSYNTITQPFVLIKLDIKCKANMDLWMKAEIRCHDT